MVGNSEELGGAKVADFVATVVQEPARRRPFGTAIVGGGGPRAGRRRPPRWAVWACLGLSR